MYMRTHHLKRFVSRTALGRCGFVIQVGAPRTSAAASREPKRQHGTCGTAGMSHARNRAAAAATSAKCAESRLTCRTIIGR